MWQRIKTFFKDSEVLFYARLQTVVGVIAAIVTYLDPAVLQPVLPAEWFPLLVIANGLATEWLRRRRDEEM